MADQKVATPATQTATPQSPASASSAISPDTEVEIKVNGVPTKVRFEELQKGYMRQDDYTRKTQKAAEAEKAKVELEKRTRELETELAKRSGSEDILSRLNTALNPQPTDPFSDPELLNRRWGEDPAPVVELAVKEVMGLKRAVADRDKTVSELKTELDAIKAANESLRKDFDETTRARQLRELEDGIAAKVPEYRTDNYINVMTRWLSNSDKPSEELGGRIGKEMDAADIAVALKEHRNSVIAKEIAAREKASEERKASATTGIVASNRPLPSLPDEIENIKNPVAKLKAKSEWAAGQLAAMGS